MVPKVETHTYEWLSICLVFGVQRYQGLSYVKLNNGQTKTRM